MAYEVPGSGKHHRRPSGDGRHAKYRNPSLSLSDKVWAAGIVAYMVLMFSANNFGRIGLTLILLGAIVWRLTHHPGDRFRNGLKTTFQEQRDFRRNTGEIPVLHPTAVSAEPLWHAPPVTVAVQPKGRPSWMPQFLALAGAAALMGMAEVSQNRAERSHQQGDDNDALLGIPGKWNNYQPTIPAMGTRGWGPAPKIPDYSNVDFAKRQQAATMGYDRDRFSGANAEKWEQFFR